jgi:hypothetical protein
VKVFGGVRVSVLAPESLGVSYPIRQGLNLTRTLNILIGYNFIEMKNKSDNNLMLLA